MITIALLWNNRKNWGDNEQTTVSAQKYAIFSSKRFYGLEKEFREETQLCELKKLQCLYHGASMDKQQGMTRENNKEKP